MKRQIRPFVVEVKHKRGNSKWNRSIWGDLDLSAMAAEATREADAMELQSPQLIDSDLAPIDAEDSNKQRVEHSMPDPQEAEAAQATTDAPAKADSTETKMLAPRPKRAARAKPKRSTAKEAAKAVASASVPPARATAPRKIYSEKERAQKLGQIEKSIGRGDSVKKATKQAGISEQTYYQWKKAAASLPKGDDLKDLLALEEENARLKKQLAERLRKENAELKKKLGLD
ncbi:transposase [Mesorhizobium xinjiangense]|uniref:transposase n=1 Tax=Mesorhizobium xinjiangense TaxID=2678685 RepID=UPI001F3BE8F8|nr:transposase [Mesorhizobium xinjiangense]